MRSWLKLKPDYFDGHATMDLIVLGGYYGDGKRRSGGARVLLLLHSVASLFSFVLFVFLLSFLFLFFVCLFFLALVFSRVAAGISHFLVGVAEKPAYGSEPATFFTIAKVGTGYCAFDAVC